ncbi:hypothetical protein SAMN05192559_102377 [Halobacillus karajensis]|uniref:Uncharacterized protein n=1 Tax=Halobacillus karajensis TaxID=195088 RepID=A0A024P5U6_9BACI|nr:hypothetical protein [Halobacillus karajensis]CDQ17829.1 hypothetical protein BN982_00067 [Halobacillus karajensis]CDQ24235.1 hypothetical protein BN983_02507 [Halobacillus karajensis]CDQ29516.1 hypothetical protein BN981_03899 [Halobacillus karajensis]SEH63085.1 hypothetical protein SAMN05192559_102377 [Halobacillus karajensis]
MLWLLLLIPAGLIALSIYFDRKRKSQPHVNMANESKETFEEIYRSEGAGKKSHDPKHTKSF